MLELDEPSLYTPEGPSAADTAGPDHALGWEACAHTGSEEASPLADLDDLDDGLDDAARLLLEMPTETDPPQEDV